MSIQSKLDEVRNLVSADFDTFLSNLADLCGIPQKEWQEEDLSELTWENIESAGVPMIRAKRIARIFRISEATPTTSEKFIIKDDNPFTLAMKCLPLELLDHFNPVYHTDPFGLKLKEVSDGQRFLVYNNEGKLNKEKSKENLQELLDGYPERPHSVVDGEIRQVYAVGDHPNRFADEHPLYGTPLRPDGTSINKNIKWTSLEENCRQLLHIAANITNEVNTNENMELDVFDRVKDSSFEEIGQRYPRAALKYQELKELGKLPQLRLKLNHSKTKGVSLNTSQGSYDSPFGNGYKVY